MKAQCRLDALEQPLPHLRHGAGEQEEDADDRHIYGDIGPIILARQAKPSPTCMRAFAVAPPNQHIVQRSLHDCPAWHRLRAR